MVSEAPRRVRARSRWSILIAASGAIIAWSQVAIATGPNATGSRARGPVAAFPAGPSPRNPAGPTPLNPTGPPPLGAPGTFARGSAARGPVVVTDPILRPQPFVGVVGSAQPALLPQLDGSFFCGVHGRGFATQHFFFDHLASADGVGAEDALSWLIEDGGIWTYRPE